MTLPVVLLSLKQEGGTPLSAELLAALGAEAAGAPWPPGADGPRGRCVDGCWLYGDGAPGGADRDARGSSDAAGYDTPRPAVPTGL